MARKKKIKIGLIVSLIFMTIVVVAALVWGFKILFVKDLAFENIVDRHLVGISKSKSERINDELDERIKDAQILVSNENVLDLMSGDVTSSEEVARKEAGFELEKVSKEVENYLKNNPDAKFKDLRESEELKKIAVRSIGEIGFSRLLRGDNRSIVFGLGADKVNLIFKQDFENNVLNGEHSIYSVSFDVDYAGQKRRVIRTLKKISHNIFNEPLLVVEVINFVDDYRKLKNVDSQESRYLSHFMKVNSYSDIIIVSPLGYILHSASEDEIEGVNLLWSKTVNRDHLSYLEGLSQNFVTTQKEGNFQIFGPFSGLASEQELAYSIMTPVFRGNELIAYITLVSPMLNFNEIVLSETGLGRTGDSFITNQDGLLITPTRFQNLDLLLQSVNTENQNDCLYEISNGVGGEATKVYRFQNLVGENTIGTHSLIKRLNWCLMSEISADEVFEISKKNKVFSEFLVLIATVIVLLVLNFFFLRQKIDKNFTIRNKKK